MKVFVSIFFGAAVILTAYSNVGAWAERDRALEVRQPLAGRGRDSNDAVHAVRLGRGLLPHQALHILVFSFFILSIPLPAVFALLFPRGGLNAADAGRKPGAKCRARQTESR